MPVVPPPVASELRSRRRGFGPRPGRRRPAADGPGSFCVIELERRGRFRRPTRFRPERLRRRGRCAGRWARRSRARDRRSRRRAARDCPVLIAQISDVHVGDNRYRQELLRTAIDEINAGKPDLVVDRRRYHRRRLSGPVPARPSGAGADRVRADRPRPGKPRRAQRRLPALRGHVRRTRLAPAARRRRYDLALVAVDSSKPDLDEGEIGREHYGWIEEGFAGEADLRVFLCHHHLMPIPAPDASGTRCSTRATSLAPSSAGSTSSWPATGTCRTSGRSAGCCSCTRVRSRRSARVAFRPCVQPDQDPVGSNFDRASRPGWAAPEPWRVPGDWPEEISARRSRPVVRAQRDFTLDDCPLWDSL